MMQQLHIRNITTDSVRLLMQYFSMAGQAVYAGKLFGYVLSMAHFLIERIGF